MSSLSPLPQAGAKAVLDATAAYRMGNQLLAFQEQYFKAFPQTTRQATGGTRPALGLNQVDPIVGMAIAEAMDGQISLLHVVRETLHGIPGIRRASYLHGYPRRRSIIPRRSSSELAKSLHRTWSTLHLVSCR